MLVPVPNTLIVSSPDFLAVARDVLARGGVLRFRALGASMRPFVRDGDYVTVARAAMVRRGDIVLYESAGVRAVLHRVLRAAPSDNSAGVVVAGDAESSQSDCVAAERVLGRVVRLERAGRDIALERARRLAVAWQRLRPARQKWARLVGLLRQR
jgi:hypothetical protein